jgi:prepilin-type N-terminal cleavage/methylation domain-containing protein
MISRKSGFSLMESLVALVILSIIFTAVWEWFGVAINSTKKIERAVAFPEVFELFVNRLNAEALKNSREGRYRIGDYEVEWQATPVRQSNTEFFNRQPSWEVVLFEVDAKVFHKGVEVTSFTTQQTDFWQNENDIRSIFGL